MARLAWLTLLLLAEAVLFSLPVAAAPPLWWQGVAQNPKRPHPAVVRVVATQPNGASLGSGALVAVYEQQGLVVTNWHVVRDAAGLIYVAFPDGFQSPARVLKADREWDLAALVIARPNAEPIPVATQAPRPGEPLTIAGYGSGTYREATGRCTQYVAPNVHRPFEMVELSAGARQGDSGGPILNQRGELAGVLFGTAAGQTTGSYCGRVRSFLASVDADFRRLPSAPTMVAQQSPRVTPPTAPQPSVASPAEPGFQRAPTESPVMRPPVASIPGGYAPLAGPPQAAPPPGSAPDAPAEPSAFDQVKSFLAAVGLFAIFMHGLRLLVPGQRRPVSRRS